MSHPSQIELIAFHERPDNESLADISLHIATCMSCRNKIKQIAEVSEGLDSGLVSTVNDSLNDEEKNLLMAYVDGGLSEIARMKAANIIAKNQQAEKYLLQYQLYHNEFDKEAVYEDKKTGRYIASEKLLSKMLSWIKSNSIANWVMVPVTIMLAVVINVVWFAVDMDSGTSNYASYQNEPYLVISLAGAKKPAVGFFNQSGVVKQPYGQAEVWEDNNRVTIQWPEIEKAGLYNFSLYKTVDHSTIIDKTNVKTNRFEFDASLLESNVSYEWHLSVLTDDGFLISTQGGVVKH